MFSFFWSIDQTDIFISGPVGTDLDSTCQKNSTYISVDASGKESNDIVLQFWSIGGGGGSGLDKLSPNNNCSLTHRNEF